MTDVSSVDASSAGHAAAIGLRDSGVAWVAGVAGESYLSLLDGLRHFGVAFVPFIHESSAVFAAATYARVQGQAAVAAVTRGPGAANALIGLHEAQQARAPVVLIVGQVPTTIRGRAALQEIDVAAAFSHVAKATFEVPSSDRVASSVIGALRLAVTAPAGPVVVVVPADCFDGRGARQDSGLRHVQRQPGSRLDDQTTSSIANLLVGSRKRVLIAGEPFAGGRQSGLVARLAERYGFAVVGAHAFPDVLPGDHPLWLGCSTTRSAGALREALRAAEVVLALGTNLGDRTTQLYDPWRARVIAVDDASAVEWDEYLSAQVYVADPVSAAQGLLALPETQDHLVSDATDWVATQRKAIQAAQDRIMSAATTSSMNISYPSLLAALDETLPANCDVICDAGSFNDWVTRYLSFRDGRRYIGTQSGSMGFAVPAAIGNHFSDETRKMAVITGDGGFLMTAPDLATLAGLGVDATVIVIRNGIQGSIALHQDLRYGPGSRFGVELPAVDHCALAEALGASARRVGSSEDLRAALAYAFAQTGTSFVEVDVDPAACSPAHFEFVGDDSG